MPYSIHLFQRYPSPKKGEWSTRQYDLLENGKLVVWGSGQRESYPDDQFLTAKTKAREVLMENIKDFDWAEVYRFVSQPIINDDGEEEWWDSAHKSVYKFTRQELYDRLKND